MCFRKHLAELFFALATQMAALPSMLPSHSQNAGGMLTQAEEGMKLFEAQQGTAAEVGIPLGNLRGDWLAQMLPDELESLPFGKLT